jgi:glucosylceramidase
VDYFSLLQNLIDLKNKYEIKKRIRQEKKMKLIITDYENYVRNTVTEEVEEIFREGATMQTVNIYPEITYQRFLGFGGAITEAAAYAYSKLDSEHKEKVIDEYFSEEGNNYSFVRSHMDSCDFALDNYSAMSDKDDVNMESFTLERDEQYIFPLLKAASMKRDEPLDIMLSPWSPPAFMKSNNDRNHGGKLLPEYREFWAEYICRYIKEYEKRGYKVNRITIQNEPEAVQTWDSCIYTGAEEKEFLRDYLHPALKRNGLLDIKVNIWDHNKERLLDRAKETIDEVTDKMIDGIAFHWYSGDHFDAISLTHELYPDKELIFTEGCVEYGVFDKNELRNAQMYAHDIIGNLNHGMNAFIDWNILLDEKGGPNHVKNYCDAPIMCDTVKGNYKENLSFHYIRHFSKYIKKDAKRVAHTKYTDKLELTTFKNVDGSVVAVMLNKNDFDISVDLRMNGKIAHFTMPKKTIASCLFD